MILIIIKFTLKESKNLHNSVEIIYYSHILFGNSIINLFFVMLIKKIGVNG